MDGPDCVRWCVSVPVCNIPSIYSLQEEKLDSAKAISEYRAAIMIHGVTMQT